ncbi:MAG: phosphoribosylformylglycinamidine synthase subunit PurL [Candidatus Thermoplasmatota archaeon]|nr:phosphoribosylformylglycinamidine synthase subunit PurL [Candidatus Thermoplasmatota archaeon]
MKSHPESGSMSGKVFYPSGTGGVWHVRIREADDRELRFINDFMSLGFIEPELYRVRDYFVRVGRDATDIELQSIAQAWSEHCSYKTSKPALREHVFPLSRRAYANGDAGVMEFDAEHVYSLKMESHNHPSAIEPYGGAGTGIGGIVRDILCMGTRPVALADPIFFGDLDARYEDLPPGTKHPKYLFSGVVAGIRDYGNRIGVPTISGLVMFDRRYSSSCLVNAGCVGFGRKEDIVKNSFLNPGDVIILAGGLTGKDGIHGVNFASRSFSSESHESDRGAVQLGDPITKEPLIHAVLQLVSEKKIKSMKDLGGGGLSAVVGEMCLSGGLGATIDIDRIPLREKGMKPWEIWISESQERMLISVRDEDVNEALSVFDFWDVAATSIGRVEDGHKLVVTSQGSKILELDTSFVVKPEEFKRPAAGRNGTIRRGKRIEYSFAACADKVMSDINACSRDWIVHMYDYEVGGKTTIKPLHGLPAFQSHGDASVLKPLERSWKGMAVTVSAKPRIASVNPYQGALHAVDELCRNLVSVGARPDSITNCLNFGSPERAEVMWEFNESVRGMADAAGALRIALPSGNVSFYNDSETGPIMPTVSLMGVGLVDDIRKCVTSDFKREGSLIYLIGKPGESLGCSVISESLGLGSTDFIPVDLERTVKLCDSMLELSSRSLFLSCHDVSDGGLFSTLAEMAFGGNIGFRIDAAKIESSPPERLLFSEPPACWAVEVTEEGAAEIEKEFDKYARLIGETGGQDIAINLEGAEIYSTALSNLRQKWAAPLWERMG